MTIFCQHLLLGRQVVNFRSLHRLWSSSRPQILYEIPQQSVVSRVSSISRLTAPSLLQKQHNFFTCSALSFNTVQPQHKVKLPFAVDERNIKEDILIYSYNNDRFYKFLTFFGIVQFFFWIHLAGFSYTTLRDVNPANERQNVADEKQPWWKKINLGQDKYRYGMVVLCISLGYLLLFISVLFPKRAVKELVLKQGGKMVKITTFGRRSAEFIPVGSINCLQQRNAAKNQIPLKIKDKWFYFLLDKKGKFHNEYLFDYLIGLKRSLK